MFCQTSEPHNFHYSSGFYTSDLFLYENGMFAYERGGESYSYVTLGIYDTINDTIILRQFNQKKIAPIGTIEMELELDTSFSNTIKIDFKCSNDSVVGSAYTIVQMEIAQRWKTDDSLNIEKHNCLRFDYESLEFRKTNDEDNLAACLTGLTGISGKRKIIKVPANARKITINTVLPYEIMKYNMMYNSTYKPIKKASMNFENTPFLVEKY